MNDHPYAQTDAENDHRAVQLLSLCQQWINWLSNVEVVAHSDEHGEQGNCAAGISSCWMQQMAQVQYGLTLQ